jgi:DNA polymerase-1
VKPIILIDGSSYLYRAFHAMPSLTNSKGFPTGAIYGMVSMLRKLMSDYETRQIAIVFDAKGKTFRDELYEKYKANRSAMPDELIQQIEPIHKMIRAMGIPILMVEGVEADDVIGTLAQEATHHKHNVLISTGDKDLAQLVNQHITLVNTMTGSVLNPDSVKEKFGIPPESIIDYLALVGDTSDNIPGVPQVGPKTAAKWLNEYGSLDNIIKNADKITGKVGENLRASLSQIPLAKKLATIKCDVALSLKLSDLVLQNADNSTLIQLCKEFEFKNWLNALLENHTEKNSEKHAKYETIFTQEKFSEWLKKLSDSDLFVLDTETTHLDYMHARIVGLSFSTKAGEAAYIPLAHDYENAPEQLSRDDILKQLKPLLEDKTPKKIGQNLKYDIEIFANHGIDLQGVAFDTMLESYVLDSASNRHDMDSLALKYLGWRTIQFEDIAGKGAKQLSFNQISIEPAATYAAEDADVTLQLHQTLWPRLAELPGLKTIFTEIEIPLISVLARMERNGVLIDAAMLEKQTIELEKRVAELEKEIFIISGGDFNLNSPKQLQEILFEKLKLPVLQKTPTGQASTADAVLQELALEFELPKMIIEFRSLSKLITTYTSKLPTQINPDTKRIHTSYNQTGAATGRLSSSDPNLQNIPIRTQEGRKIRQAFIAAKNYKLICADYSQIELRIMAHISEDSTLLKAFEQDLDIHTATASEVLGIPLEKISSEERRRAKAINFGLIYGMSAFGLAKQLGIDRHDAQKYIELYFARYPKVREYMENTRTLAHKNGFVETIFGRRLYTPDINSSQIPRQKAAERAAINAPLQGTAADIIKRAMISLDEWINQHKEFDAKMIMQVHDELVFEVADKNAKEFSEVVRKQMMSAAKLKVPLSVSIGIGDNWNAASED